MLEWKKEAPNAPGTWVRINVAGKPQLHHVFETRDSKMGLEDGLWMHWGWGGQTRLAHPGPDHANFLWLGPLPDPPKEEEEA